MKILRQILPLLLFGSLSAMGAETLEAKVPVHMKNINTVETHMQLARYQKAAGGINRFKHAREMVPIDKQTTIAMNRDTFYSLGVINLDKPVIITLPDAGERYMALQVIDEDHYTPFIIHEPGPHTLTRENVGTRYAFVMIRTFVDPNDPEDVRKVHALQDAITLEGGGKTPFVRPDYDMETYRALFKDLQKLLRYWNGDTRGAMGKRGEVNELIHTVATIAGWGLNPPYEAMYEVVNGDFDPQKLYRIDVPAHVPVKAFWSISVYNKKGFFEKNDLDAYTVNSVTAKKNDDGSVTVWLGACKGRANCLPLPADGGYYQWRMYRPEPVVLEGRWHYPEAVEVKP